MVGGNNSMIDVNYNWGISSCYEKGIWGMAWILSSGTKRGREGQGPMNEWTAIDWWMMHNKIMST